MKELEEVEEVRGEGEGERGGGGGGGRWRIPAPMGYTVGQWIRKYRFILVKKSSRNHF